MAKRLAGTRALVHVLKPNKTKAPGPVKRARKSISKARRTGAKIRAHKTRSIIKGVGKGELAIVRGAHGAVNRAIPGPRVRKRTIVLRGEKGRFAGRARA